MKIKRIVPFLIFNLLLTSCGGVHADWPRLNILSENCTKISFRYHHFETIQDSDTKYNYLKIVKKEIIDYIISSLNNYCYYKSESINSNNDKCMYYIVIRFDYGGFLINSLEIKETGFREGYIKLFNGEWHFTEYSFSSLYEDILYLLEHQDSDK